MDILSILREYYPILIGVLLAILEIIFMIVKKRPVSVDGFMSVLSMAESLVPSLINKVEIPGHGIEKKEVVIDSAIKIVSRAIGRDLSIAELDTVKKTISEQIELVLSTPQKKEIL